MRRIQFQFLFAVPILIVVAVVGGALLRFHRPLPQVRGEMVVDGASAPIDILRDRYGIPHIRAAGRDDAIFALGFVHAQDRLWQMEVQRRAAAGRLSEALGPGALATDRFMRTIGFARAARDARAALDAGTLAWIDAYVRGINAFLARTSGWRLPVEYALTGIRPEPWTADDVVAAMKLVAWGQGMNWREDLMRLRLTAKIGAARAGALLPGALDGATILPRATPADAAALDAIARLLDIAAPPSAAASNAWVLDGTLTASGRPLLASDPHIPSQAPATWYLAHVTGGGLDVIGATFPGAPAVVIGHNGRVAWGITNAMADAQDLFIVRHDEPTATFDEVVRVKGQADERLRVRVSANGPVISDLVGERGALALRWSGLDREDATVAAFFALNDAGDAAAVRAAAARMHAPVLSIVYADAAGSIGYVAAGSVPVRDAQTGAWTSYVSAALTAWTADPPSGRVITANNTIGGDGPPMSTSFDLPYRAARIAEMLDAETAVSIEDVARMQQDVVSLQPRALAPLLFDAAEPRDLRSASALAALRAWDGGMRAGSAEAALFKRYYHEAARALLRDELGDQLFADYQAAGAALARAMHGFARSGADAWCDDVELPGRQTCGVVLGEALARAIDSLDREQGSQMGAWRWDAGNTVRFAHAPMDAVGWLRPFFSRELRRPGDSFTVNPVMRIRDQALIASYRQIVDVGNWDDSRFVIPLGQSGHPMSAHYDDLLPLWNEGRSVPMAFSEAAVRAAAWRTLTLRPRPLPPSSADTPRER
jgi:penicillin amidase